MNNIQKRFLISADIKRWLEKHTVKLEKTEQFYIAAKEECFYLKTFPETYTKVVVDTTGNETVTLEDEEAYFAERKQSIGRKLLKNIYTVNIGKETSTPSKPYLLSLPEPPADGPKTEASEYCTPGMSFIKLR